MQEPSTTAAVAAAEMDTRWQAWRARGAAHDKKQATRYRQGAALLALAGLIWLLVRVL